MTCGSLVFSAVLIGMISWGMTGRILEPPVKGRESTWGFGELQTLEP